MSCVLQILLVLSLLHTTSSTVYYVVPDDHYTINSNTNTLQHYLNNIKICFTSHTQLHFLPGIYYLNTDLIIQHVSNLSLIGNRTNERIISIIKCTSPAGIVVVHSSNIVIADLVMVDCGKEYYRYDYTHGLPNQKDDLTSLCIIGGKSITVRHFYIRGIHIYSGLLFINSMGNLTNVISHYILIRYDDLINDATLYNLHVSNCYVYSEFHTHLRHHALEIQQINSSSDTTIVIENCNFISRLAILNICIGCSGSSTVTVRHCFFTHVRNDILIYPKFLYEDVSDYDIDAYYNKGKYHYNYFDDYYNNELNDYDDNSQDDYNTYDDKDKEAYDDLIDKIIHPPPTDTTMVSSYYENCKNNQMPNKIQLIGCHFVNISGALTSIIKFEISSQAGNSTMIMIVNTIFYNCSRDLTAIIANHHLSKFKSHRESLHIKDTKILSSSRDNKEISSKLIYVGGMNMHLNGLIVSNNPGTVLYGGIIDAIDSYVLLSNYNEISYNVAYCAIQAGKIHLLENTTLNVSNNVFYTVFNNLHHSRSKMEDCFIQYRSDHGNLDTQFQLGHNINYSILFIKNKIFSNITNASLMHCSWDMDAAFMTSNPIRVNQHFIHYDNFTLLQKSGIRLICMCDNTQTYCNQEEIGPFYPGQLVQLSFALSEVSKGSLAIERKFDSTFACSNEIQQAVYSFQLEGNECKNVSYTVNHKSGKWCELCYTVQPMYYCNGKQLQRMEMYTITLLPCPKGFALHPQGYCHCDSILSSHVPSLTTCDINHQTIPRPPNTWISAHTINNTHSYHVSLHCPFDYCLPHLSQLNLSTPDSQCQFNRSGVLCGQCQHGLSTVFGSSQCKQCSNVYLLIIVPIGIAGLALVILLFTLNLTVTDGKINSYLLYMNVININISVFFLTDRSLPYTFVAFANLDLGIETCFYDGMDDYAKVWLQLVFPIYLVSIATLLIITSRYSSIIQRLTARRALPVLATLFLLSYTKVLLTVSNVLFPYTFFTNLPSNHTTLVWSVDSNVPLFGVKFTIVFIVCLILFLILLPFNVVLLFTKSLSYFKIVTKFKPLLDAYQGPYKIRYYYWTGLQLVTRAIFFGVSSLDRETNLMIGSVLLAISVWLHGKVSPFNGTINNAIESSFLLNLLIIFIVSLYTYSVTVVNIFVSIAMLKMVCITLYNGYELVHGIFLYKITRMNLIQIAAQFGKDVRAKSIKEDKQVELINVVPEVKFNYKEFQEPLLAIEK